MTQDLAAFDWWAQLTDPAYLRAPYPILARLQQAGPVHRDAASGVFFVLGHRAFSQVVKMPEMGRDTRQWSNGWDRPGAAEQDPVGHRLLAEFSRQMINADPPDHGRMRGVYDPAFHPAAMTPLRDMIVREAGLLLEAMPDHGTIDMIPAFAAPLPLRVLRNLFAMPPAMDAQMAEWSAALIKIGDVMMTPEQKRAAAAALTAFKAYLREHLASGEREPNRMIDRVIAAWRDGTLDDEETLTNLVSMLVAGHETTVTLIGNGLLLLLEHPAELERLRADRGLMRTAVEEFMRVSPGGNMILRVALQDVVVEGTPIPAGSLLIGLIGAVNRDPARFERPDALDVGRRPNAHFTFGGGVHFCIGAPLARLEAQIGFDLLLDRFARLTLDGTAEWRLDRINARGLASLPVRVDRP